MRSLLLVFSIVFLTVGATMSAQSTGSATLAVVGGQTISMDDVFRKGGFALLEAEQLAYERKMRTLESLIEEKLIGIEASRRSLTSEALLDLEVNSRISDVTDQEVADFYEAHQSDFNGSESELQQPIRTYLRDQRVQAERQKLVNRIKQRTRIDVRLKAPPIGRLSTRTDGSPLRGNAAAAVSIVEFSDFHCPFCKEVFPTLLRVLEIYGPRVNLVFKHLPLEDAHPFSRATHEASECAREQARFWEYHDHAFSNDRAETAETLMRWAEQLNLNTVAFRSCLDSGRSKEVIQRDIAEAERMGITFTPAILINGRVVSGSQPLETFVRIIDEELDSPMRRPR